LKKNTILLLITLASFSVQAQLNNRVFDLQTWNDSISTNHFGLTVENLNFVRNTEYQSRLLEGETLLGFQLMPTIQFRAFENVQFSGGLFLKKDFGNNGFDRISPVFTVDIRQKKHEFLLGNIKGSTTHGLIEPLYSFDKLIKNRLENGLQHVYKSNKIKTDAWLDWETMIYRNSPFREEFTAGFSGEYTLIKKNQFSWSFPVQVLVHHRGGEIDDSPLPVETQFNFAYGTKLKIPFADSTIRFVEVQGYLTYYEDQSSIPADSFIDGLGQYLSILFQGKNAGIMFNYWDAHQFQATNGDVVFQSLSTQNAKYVFNYRKMAQVRFLYEKEIYPHFYFVGRYNVMYDFHQKTRDMVMEIYLKYVKTIGW
jgi:hypothetical protein